MWFSDGEVGAVHLEQSPVAGYALDHAVDRQLDMDPTGLRDPLLP